MKSLIFLAIAGPMLVLIFFCNRALSEQFRDSSRLRRRQTGLSPASRSRSGIDFSPSQTS